MFKKISVLLILTCLLFGCTKTLLSPDDTRVILELFKERIIAEGLGPAYIINNGEVWDPGYDQTVKTEKQWIWSYEQKFGVASGILSCKIFLIRFTDPFPKQGLKNFKWVVFPKTYYHTGPNMGIKETVDYQFYQKQTLYVWDLEHFINSKKPPQLPEGPQVLLEIIWYAAKDFHNQNRI